MRGKVMSLEDYKRVLDVFRDWVYQKHGKDERLYLIISGGEPSIVNNLRDYVDLAKELRYIVTIVTNAYNPYNVINSEPDLIEVSMDFADPRKHDFHRGVVGLWDRAKFIIENYRNVCIRSTWIKTNTNDIIKIKKMFKCPVVASPYIFQRNGKYYKLSFDLMTKLKFKINGIITPKQCDHSRFATVDPYMNVLLCPFVRINVGELSFRTLNKLSEIICPAKPTSGI